LLFGRALQIPSRKVNAVKPLTEGKMTRLSMAVVALLGVSLSPPINAKTLNFYFSFTSANGTVTGEIDGLADNTTGAPSAVYLDSSPGGWVPTPFLLEATGSDSFTVKNGLIVAAQFTADDPPCSGGGCILGLGGVGLTLSFPSGGGKGDGSLLIGFTPITVIVTTTGGEPQTVLECVAGPCEGEIQDTDTFVTFSGTDLAFAPTTPSSIVPEQSTWAMMLLGFAGLGFVSYRQRHKLAGVASV
jgi:hypothetical protein